MTTSAASDRYAVTAELGRGGMAVVYRARDEERAATDPTICAPAIATLHLHLGDHDRFYQWLNRGLDARDPYALALGVENLWDPARHEPRYQDLLRRVGLPVA